MDLYWLSPFSLSDGYGVASISYVEALLAHGVSLNVHECWFSVHSALPKELLDKIQADHNAQLRQRIGVCLATPGAFRRLPTAVRIGYTMYESTQPEKHFPSWYPEMASADALFVPTESSREIFKDKFPRPIHIVPLPISAIYMNAGIKLRGQSGRPFTFGMHGTLTERKCPMETVKAFQNAFPYEQYKDVRLEIKTKGILHRSNEIPIFEDKRIKVISNEWPPSILLRWLYKLDCHLFLSRGEGFGIPPRESLVTGCPVIISQTGGMLDLTDYCMSIPIASQAEATTGGLWDEPDWDATIAMMRYVYENREKVNQEAIIQAERYRANYRWDKIVAKFVNAVEKVEKEISSGKLVPITEVASRKKITDVEPLITRMCATIPPKSKILVTGFNTIEIGTRLAEGGFIVEEVAQLSAPIEPLPNYVFRYGNLFELRSLLGERHFDYAVAFIPAEFRRRNDVVDVLNEIFGLSDDAMLVVEGKPSGKLYVALEPLNFVSEALGNYTIVAIDKKEARRGVEMRNLVRSSGLPRSPRIKLLRTRAGVQHQ